MSPDQLEALSRLKREPQPYNIFHWRVRRALMNAGLVELYVIWGEARLMLRLSHKRRVEA